ncbi:protoporphyrinogen oxidase [uncultured Draconibacterium sp.]|uniref:protoporphyrinogen oxidase n=1 Tax=uncultured Draconibacterium sp. TaxID=1573823 RepID=UPI0029C7DF1F|nr:protoporphyrinogen oxidase [uncultured Draconibacterium sp.]
MQKNQLNIAVIGAGLTGLTTAFYLKKFGFEVTVFEKNDQAGGVIKTHRKNGFVFESGPNTGSMSQEEAAELFEDLADDCKLEYANKSAEARWIWMGDKWHEMEMGGLKAITTPLFTWYDKFRILGEPFRKPGTDPNETIADMVRRRMGKSFLRNAVDPFLSGVYAGDPEKLVTRFALPKLYWLEQNYGSFIGGSIKQKKARKKEPPRKANRQVFSVENGLDNLIKALVKNIGDENIKLGCKNLEVNTSGNQDFSVDGKSFTHVVSTAGSHALENLFPFFPKEKMQAIDKMTYAKVTQVVLGFNNWKGIPIKSFGGLVPSAEKRDVLGILLPGSFLKNRAPENGALLSVFMGGIKRPEMFGYSDDKIKEIAEREVRDMMGLDSFEPDLLEIFRYPNAIPQYSFESEEKLQAITDLETEFKGLTLAGNMRDGIGMADRIKQGRTIANQFATDYL